MTVAFIPVRGGSKSIPLKNIKPLCGRPLVYWTVKAACECPHIDQVFVATDSPEIEAAVASFGFEKAVVIGRGEETATDTASTESALLEFAEAHEFDTVALVQATSPLLAAADLTAGFEALATPGTDSVLSVVRQKRFLWRTDESGLAAPVNYDPFARPRRQEFDGQLVENGAFYLIGRAALLQSKNRLAGNIRAVEMAEESYFEIDEPSDWVIAEALLGALISRRQAGKASLEPAAGEASPQGAAEALSAAGSWKPAGEKTGSDLPEIKLLLTDCDGCLTDSGMIYTEAGDIGKVFSTRDGAGLRRLAERGVLTGIVTGENSPAVQKRAEKLQLPILAMGVANKLPAIQKICAAHGVALENTAYIGDDLMDLEALRAVGFAACPADAVSPEVRAAVHYVCRTPGGRGAVREVCELILAATATPLPPKE